MTNSIDELKDAGAIFVIGSNTTVAHPLIATRIYRAKAKGAKLIVADPRRIQLAEIADVMAHQHLGTDVALINGMANWILQNGWQDQEYIDQRCEGFEAFEALVQKYTPEYAESITGVAADDIKQMAEMYASAKVASIVYCMGITQHTSGVDNVRSLANLAMLCGNVGMVGGGVNPLRGQNNVQGACDMGGLPNVYPAYQPVDSVDAQIKFEKAWGVELSNKVGLKLMDMIHGLDTGEVKALYVMGENPYMSDPDTAHVEHALKSAELVILQDIFPNETSQFAHVILPGTTYAEKDGTFSNSERRVQRVREAIPPQHDSKPDWRIIMELSNRYGLPMDYESPRQIFDEITTVTPSYAGISYDRLEGEGLCWPVPDSEHPGTTCLHVGKFARGRGAFAAIDHRDPAEKIDGDYPLWLTTGRAHVHYHTGTMTRNSPTLHAQMPEGYVEINPQDAEAMGIREGDLIKVSSRRGEITAPAVITEMSVKGLVFVPFHFIEASANVLTNPALDPICAIPEYKVCAVKVEKAA